MVRNAVDVVVVGAGLAGLSAARELVAAGRSVTVLDKGRGVGGRMATRRIGAARIDHGAQFFTTRSDEFVTTVASAVEAGAVAEWCRGFGGVDGYPRYRGINGMSDLCKWLAEGIDVRLNETVVDLADHPAAAYILTPPVPQTLAICSFSRRLPPPLLHRELARIDYHPVLALLATFDQPLSVPEPGGVQQPDHPVITFVADDQMKGITTVPALTLHAAHGWSVEHWLASDDDIIADLLHAARDFTSGQVPSEAQVQRWRYAGPVTPWPEATVCWGSGTDGDPVIALAGDAFAGPKVEGAFRSGRAAALRVCGNA